MVCCGYLAWLMWLASEGYVLGAFAWEFLQWGIQGIGMGWDWGR